MDDVRYWVAFNCVQGIGPVRVRALLDHFGSLDTAWHAEPVEWARAGLDRRALAQLGAARARLDLDAEMDRLGRLGVRTITWQEAVYPERLRQINASPPVLYIKGELKPDDEWAVAVVGSRSPTSDGKEITRQLVTDMARAGVTVVSGLARGIDGQAHQAALDAGGRTLAVLACGLDTVYPPEHRALAQRIAEQGALISDYPLGTRPDRVNFVPRNRIISGLSRGVLVVEGRPGSGSLWTAKLALEQGREVFAVPGNILRKTSHVPNQLIRDGAKAVLEANDILEELNLTRITEHAEARAALPQNEDEARLLQIMSSEPRHVDEISRLTELPIAQVTSTLALMELKGLVRQTGGMRYSAVREGPARYTVRYTLD